MECLASQGDVANSRLVRRPSYGAAKGLIHSIRPFAAMLLVFAAALWAAPVAAQTASPDAKQAAPIKIVAFGDSLTAGYGLPGPEAFPARLERALKAKGVNVEIENAGVSGDTASGGLSRIDWSIPDGTDAVILELGANDMLRGVDPKVTREALDSILAKLKERNIAVLLCGMRAAPNLGDAYVRNFESIFDDLARKYDVVFYPFFLDGVATQAKFALRDGLHPNAAGVDVIVAGIMPKVEELIARLGSKRSRS
jgi:acyl-CoA thioesterase-1